MNNIDIKINIPTIIEYSKSLKRTIKEEDMLLMIESFSHYVKRLYIKLLDEAMSSNRYKGIWEPVDDEGYLEFIGTTPRRDMLGLISESLEVKKIGRNFIIRITPHVRYPDSKLYLARVIRAIDSGTTKFTARPIFSKILKFINSNILDIWRGYLLKERVI